MGDIEIIQPKIETYIAKMIRRADLIVYPIGSFYSSVIANLLPLGVKEAILENPNPKVFTPNSFYDSEMIGISLLSEQVEILCRYIGVESPKGIIDYVIYDPTHEYPFEIDRDRLIEIGVKPIESIMINNESPKMHPTKYIETLLSLC
jgi:2-phospho-L-lactate transferase/gluconeogenesis factor (CofD/UPF0052 family)